MKSWRIVKWDKRPERASQIDFACLFCGNVSSLLVKGMSVAQCNQGLIFDSQDYSTPEIIQCPHCRRKLETN